MFCYKCGNKLSENAAFCHKCGAKLIIEESAQQIPDALTSSSVTPNTVKSAPQQSSVTPEAAVNQNGSAYPGFKEFVDSRIRETTKFQSAEDLLTNSKPLSFIWKCFAASAVFFIAIGLVRGATGMIANPVFPLFIAVFGYAAAFIAGGIIRTRYCRKFFKEIDGSIDTDDLIGFLNANLSYLRPNFHEWGYMTQGGFIYGTITALVSCAVWITEKMKFRKKRKTQQHHIHNG